MYEKQEQHLPSITPDMIRELPDQTCMILNRLIRFYEQYRDESYSEIVKNTTTIAASDDVINAIQTDVTNIHGDINNINDDISDINSDISGINTDIRNINNDIDAIEGDINNLAAVARSGSYNDLLNKPTIPVITMQTTDPGEGAALAANHFIAVYV